MSEVRCLLTTRPYQNLPELSKFAGRVDAGAAEDILSAISGVSRLSRGIVSGMRIQP
jgi:hypothetical protein